MSKAIWPVLGLWLAAPCAAQLPEKPAIHLRSQWSASAAGAIPLDETKVRIIIHHADILVTDEMKKTEPKKSWEESKAYARQVQYLHKRVNGWSDIGYHYLVDWEGRILQGRLVNELGAHTDGHNEGSIGIALMGDLQNQHPTQKQLKGLKSLLAWLTYAYKISPENIHGHHDYNATACPGVYLENEQDPHNPLRRIRLELLASRRHEIVAPQLLQSLQGDLPALFGAPGPRATP